MTEARRADGADRRHTLNGYLIHHAAATFWAVLHAAALAEELARVVDVERPTTEGTLHALVHSCAGRGPAPRPRAQTPV